MKNKDMSLMEKSRLASKAVGKKILEQHRKTGEPIISWKDGRVVYLSPYDLKEVEPPKYASAGEEHSEYGAKNSNSSIREE